MKIRSIQEWGGAFNVDMLPEEGRIDPHLNFHKEKNVSLECSCGEKFYKIETATEHLRANENE